jgi:hypothetical protein
MKYLRENLNLLLCPLAVLSFLFAATTYVPPISDSFKLFLDCASILSIALPIAVLIFGFIDVFKYKRKIVLNYICMAIAAAPWIILLFLLIK